MKNDNNKVINGVASVASTKCTNEQQWTKYHSRQGHGFAAEDANAQWDAWHGKRVSKVGMNNAKNGPDRIVNSVGIQTKYHATAARSVDAAFENGTFRYAGQRIEVPRDQYDQAVALMRERILQGKVQGVMDPEMARHLVVKGHFTYNEAVRIAKAGNMDSIKFDVRSQSVACAFACGLSFAVNYFTAKRRGMSHGDALKHAGKEAAKSGATTLATGVAAQQLLRTHIGRDLAAAATKAIKPVVQSAMNTQSGSQVLTKTATLIAGREVTGTAAANVLTKAARTNAVVSAVVFVGTSIPDTVRLCRGKISGRQYAENTAANAASVGGGWAGASAGAALGTAICPGVGTVIGTIVGGLGGGVSASLGTKKLFSLFR